MPEVMEADVGKTSSLQERLEGSVHEVVAAHGRAYPCREHDAVILPEPRKLFVLFLLAFMKFLDGLYSPGG